MDWNWFFSSLAQSVAAIAGLLGAFMIARVLASQSQYQQNRARTRELFDTACRLQDEFRTRYFEWYNKNTLRQGLARLEELLTKDRHPRTREEYYEEIGFSPFQERATVLQRITETIEGSSAEPEALFGYQKAFQDPSANLLIRELREEREAIERQRLEARHHCREIRRHLAETAGDPESSKVAAAVGYALIALFLFGIVIPLAVLPVTSGTLEVTPRIGPLSAPVAKGTVLGLITAVFVPLILTFVVINNRLRYPQEERESLARYLRLSSYSPYLAVMAANQARGATSDAEID